MPPNAPAICPIFCTKPVVSQSLRVKIINLKTRVMDMRRYLLWSRSDEETLSHTLSVTLQHSAEIKQTYMMIRKRLPQINMIEARLIFASLLVKYRIRRLQIHDSQIPIQRLPIATFRHDEPIVAQLIHRTRTLLEPPEAPFPGLLYRRV